ncbi:cupin domain-containing protein [Streptomyces sp. NPDC054871]
MRNEHGTSTKPAPVNIADRLAGFSELWSQKTVATLNDYEVKLAKLHGEFVWHSHEDTDELFLVISGQLTIQLRGGDVTLAPGSCSWFRAVSNTARWRTRRPPSCSSSLRGR